MDIAFLSFFNGLHYRGVETFVHEVASRMASRCGVTVYQNGKARESTPYRIKYLPSLYTLPVLDPVPDVLIPVNGRLQTVLARIRAISGKTKIIISGQSGPGFDDRLNLYTFPDTFVSLTDYQAKWAAGVNPRVKTVKIPNGVDPAKFNPRVKPHRINLPRPVVLYVAAMEEIKRHNLLIEALARTQASLLLVGQGSLEDTIVAQAKTKLPSDRFALHNYPYSQMPGIYTACDLFVYPTAPWESFGIAILEAMASGLPVVATDDPIRREIAGPAGIFADPVNPEAFAGAIRDALSRDWGDSPLSQAGKYSWDVIAGSYFDLCKSL